MYRKHGLSSVGKSDKQQLVHKLDILLAKLIKQRDAEDPCITCGRIPHENDDPRAWHAGHFRPRGAMATRFNPSNLNKQCAGCNVYGDGKAYEHGLAIDAKYVHGTAAELYRLSKTIKQWDTRELEQLIAAAKHSYLAYTQLYNEFTSSTSQAAR